MKKDILKIAGVKSEKEFYKKFPTKEAFMAKHGGAFKKAAMGASMVKKQLTQLTDFANPPQAQVGRNINGIPSQYQLQTYNPYSGNVLNSATYNNQTGMFNSNTGQVSMADTQAAGFKNSGNKTLDRTIKDLSASDIQSGVQMTSTIGSNVQKVSNAIKQKKEAKRLNALAPVILQASGTRPEETRRRYVRPEDNLVNPGELAPSYGTGTNFLAKDGMQIGGNLTEIQNMYNPGDIYSDMGYEPLSESDVVKQYKKGGFIPKAQLGIIQEAVNTAGDLTAGLISIGTNKLNKQSEQILGQAGFQSGMQDLQQNQYSGFMEDGGWVSHDWQPQVIAKFGDYDLKDLLKPDPTMDTLRTGGSIRNNYMGYDENMSMMQMGGELETHWGGEAEPISYNPYLPDGGETVMFRGQSHEEADGKGRTGIGITFGDNPVEVERGEPAVKLQDGGSDESLVVFGDMKIPSYGVSEIGDDKAKSMKFKHYGKHLSKLEDKQNKTINKSLSLIDSIDSDSPFDLLKLNSGKMSLVGADMKLKDLAMKKQTLANVQNAILDTADEYGLESAELAKGNIKQAKLGAKLKTAQFGFQSNTPPWQSPEPLPFFRGPGYGITPSVDVKSASAKTATKSSSTKSSSSTKGGSKSSTKEVSTKSPEPVSLMRNPSDNAYEAFTKRWDAYAQPKAPLITVPYKSAEAEKRSTEAIKKEGEKKSDKSTSSSETAKKDKFDLNNLLDMAAPYLRHMIKNPFDPTQIMAEAASFALLDKNGVQAQTFQPLLEQITSISLQDQLNEIQADVNASKRMVGNNPAALAMIDAQAAAAKNKVLGEQFRTNQMLQAETRRRNLGLLNDATLKNMAILDQQYVRGSESESRRKAQAITALSSIADKIAKNKAETLQANVMANMYPQYTFGPKGRIYNTGLTRFNIPDDVGADELTDTQKDQIRKLNEKIVTKSGTGEVKSIKEKEQTKSRNGSIVKALKNF